MDKNNEQKNNKTPEMKPKQDSFRPWLKLIPAAAVFAAVCVTCYQADKSPVETTSVSDNNRLEEIFLPFFIPVFIFGFGICVGDFSIG